MFQLPAFKLQSVLECQANQFMAYLGAGDFNYQTRELSNGHYRERKSVAEKADLRQTKKFITEPTVNQTSIRRELFNQVTNSTSQHSTVDDLYNSYKLSNISGPQWTTWRKLRSSPRRYRRHARLPPSPSDPQAELYMDIHEERMEGLAIDFEEAPMSLIS